MRDVDQFADYVRERSPGLLRGAWLLTDDWHSAQDLVQTSLEECWPRWETAELLGCSTGTVKAHASRGLQELRSLPGLAASLGWETTDD